MKQQSERIVAIDYGRQASISLHVEGSSIFEILIRHGAPPESAREATNAIIGYLAECAKSARAQ